MSTLAIAQPSGNVRSYPYTFEGGGFSKDGVYSNYCLGFSFQIPDGWEIIPRFGGANDKARNVGGSLRIFSLRRPNDDLSSISLEATSATGKVTNAQNFVFSQVERVMSEPSGGHELIANAFPVDFGGTLFYRAEYKGLKGYSGAFYTALIYTKFRGFFVGETITAGSLKDLDQTADSLLGISFEKDQVNPKCVMGPEETPASGRVGRGIGSSLIDASGPH